MLTAKAARAPRRDAASIKPRLDTRTAIAPAPWPRPWRGRILALLPALWLPPAAWAHAIDERHELPAPLFLFVLGAGLAVGLSFALIAGLDNARADHRPRMRTIALGPLWPWVHGACALMGLLAFGLVLAAALLGTGNPMMNLAPTLVWGVWWLGGTLVVAFLGNLWPAFDPWRTLFTLIDGAARRLGRARGATLGWRWPAALNAWPAVLLLLVWAGFELVFPLAAAPRRIGIAALAWTLITLLGMVAFGRETWQRHADPFHRYFDVLGRFAFFGASTTPRHLELRAPGAGLLANPPAGNASVGLVIAMLSTVLFDGLLGGATWATIASAAKRVLPMDANAYLLGILGLAGLWVLFFGIFHLACAVTHLGFSGPGTAELKRTVAPTLVPIAIGYAIAHNYGYFIDQLRNLPPLLNDPLARGWTWLGISPSHATSDPVSPGGAWVLAIGAVVGGHVVAVWLAHRVMRGHYAVPRARRLASLPLTAVMMVYTCVSLAIIAEPMVVYRGGATNAVPNGDAGAAEPYDRRAFDAAAWKASLTQPNDEPIRLRMVDSLLRQHTLKGMTRAQIVALIGTPPRTNYFTDYDFVYWLGPERGFISVDSAWLLIRFDDNDRVSEARLTRD